MKSANAMSVVLSIDGNQAIGSRGDFALCYKIDYPEKYSQSKADFEQLHDIWNKALRYLPDNTIVVKSDIYEKEQFDVSTMPAKTFIEKANQRYFSNREYIKHKGYIFFIHPAIGRIYNETCRNPFVFPKIEDFNKEDKDISQFCSEIRQACDIISQSQSVYLTPLNEDEILRYTTYYFNGFQDNYLTDLFFEKDLINVDGKKVGMFSINNEELLPTIISSVSKDAKFSSNNEGLSYYAGFLDDLGLPLMSCSHIYNQIIIIDPKTIHIEHLKKSGNALRASKFLDPANENNANRKEDTVKTVISDESYRLIRGCNNIIFWSDNDIDFSIAKDKISSIFKIKEFMPVYPTKSRLKEQFLCSFFLNASCIDDANLYITDLKTATSLFINNTAYKNDPTGIYFEDRLYNIPVRYDFWDLNKKRKTSRGFCIFTRPGGGKSYTALHILTQQIEQDTPHIIVDIGGSYTKFAHLLPKEDCAIIEYVPGESIGLNPFGIEPGEEIDSSKIESVGNFVWTLIKKSNQPTELERTSMRKLILAYYSYESEFFCWRTFYNFIKENADNIKSIARINEKEADSLFDIEEFLHAGSDFMPGGAYSELLNVDKDKNLITQIKDKRLLLFIMDKARESTLLLSVMLQSIYSCVEKVIWENRSRKGVIFFDEVAEFLKHHEILMQLAFYAQASRKHNGSLGIILQNINQLPNNELGKALLENLETFIFLGGGTYKEEINRINLSEHDAVQIASLSSQFSMSASRRYSEIYIKSRYYPGNVYRIESPLEAFYAFQTDGAIYDRMMHMYDELQDMEEVIRQAIDTDLAKTLKS